MGDRGTPRLTAAQITTILKRHGFALVGQSGSHQEWRNPETPKRVIVAQHKGKILPLGTMRSICCGERLVTGRMAEIGKQRRQLADADRTSNERGRPDSSLSISPAL